MSKLPTFLSARSHSRSHSRAAAVLAVGALALGGLAVLAPSASALAVPTPTASYDMSHSGSSLLDVSGNGHNGTLTGLADSSFLDTADGDVLRFKNNGYVSLPQGLVTASDNDFTVEMTMEAPTPSNSMAWVIGDGVGAWNTNPASPGGLGNYVFMNGDSAQGGYNGAVLGAIRVYSSAGNGEVRMPAGGSVAAGFTTITMVSSGQTLTLYRDGVAFSTLNHSFSLSSIIPGGSVLGYLGRSLYSPDPNLTGDVSGVKFWDSALSADQVAASMPSATQKSALSADVLQTDLAGLSILGGNASLDQVTADLSLPASVDGNAVSWSSSDPSTVSDAGVVTRSGTDKTVTLTATAGSASHAFTITVMAQTAADSLAAAQADLDAVSLSTPATENLPLVTTGTLHGSTITWTSSNNAVVTPTDPSYVAPSVGAADPFQGGGLVHRPAYGDGDATATLTATATLNGQSVSKAFDVTVAEQGRAAPNAGYAAAYFRSDSDEKIYEAATSGNSFFSFSPVAGGNPVITSNADTTGLRDPFILRSHEGDRYYMVATDLCIGCGTSWGDSQSKGSLKIEVYSSTDLVHWSRTNGGPGGITVNQPAAGMTWAPEAYWDDALQSYVVFFSSRLYSDATHTNSDNLYARGFYVLTRDFKTFTAPHVWADTGFARIDSTVIKIGGYYYRFSKNEESGPADGLIAGKDIFLERSKVLTSVTSHSDWNADPSSTWQLLDTNMTTPETGQAGEGPEVIKLNQGDPANTTGDGYVFLVDNYGAGGYRAFTTTGSAIAASSQAARLSQSTGWGPPTTAGLPASPRHGAFVSVPQTVLDAMKGWTGIAAVGSTTTVSLTGRVLTAHVSAADSGQVAGTVTFTGTGWSATRKVVDGVASVTVPDTVSGTVTVGYDGYRDHLVSTSSTTTSVPAVTPPTTQPAPTTTTLQLAKKARLRHGVATVQVTVRVSTGSGPAAGTVRVTVAGRTYTATIAGGVAHLRLRLTKARKYVVVATYGGTGELLGSRSTIHTIIVKGH